MARDLPGLDRKIEMQVGLAEPRRQGPATSRRRAAREMTTHAGEQPLAPGTAVHHCAGACCPFLYADLLTVTLCRILWTLLQSAGSFVFKCFPGISFTNFYFVSLFVARSQSKIAFTAGNTAEASRQACVDLRIPTYTIVTHIHFNLRIDALLALASGLLRVSNLPSYTYFHHGRDTEDYATLAGRERAAKV